MNTQSDRHTWFVLLDGQRRGPLAYDDLTRAAKEGIIAGDTPVWRAGWKNWHPARSVKGLVIERGPAAGRQAVVERPAAERPVIEAPLAPHDDDGGWDDDQGRGHEEETYQYLPPQHREMRRPQPQQAQPQQIQSQQIQHPQSEDMVALRWEQRDDEDHIFAEEWRMLAEQRPAQERGRAVIKASVPARIGRRPGTLDIDDFADDMDSRPAPRGGAVAAFFKRTAIGMSAILLLAGGGWVLLKTGILHPGRMNDPGRPAALMAPDLPAAVIGVPAVVALQRNDPEAFEKFRKRYLEIAAAPGNLDARTLTRNALRKSVKHLLAISSGDVLLDLTETSLAYLQGLQASNPESCVWLADETKGARLTSNLSRELPALFSREMMALERIAATNPHMQIAPMSDAEAQPYIVKVGAALTQQNVRSDLQQRERLDASEFAPYCSLVIAFYKAVLDLPRDDRINVLRYLYAQAAANADVDLNAKP